MLSTIAQWDQLISRFIVEHRTPSANTFFTAITMLGDWYGVLTVWLLVVLCLWKKRKDVKMALWPFITVCSSWVLLFVIKNIVQRSRPTLEQLVHASSYSFPSMHACLSVLFYGWVAFLLTHQRLVKEPYHTPIRIGCAVLAILIGFSRMYLNVHYCTDVLCGWLFGGLLLWISLRLYRDTENRSH